MTYIIPQYTYKVNFIQVFQHEKLFHNRIVHQIDLKGLKYHVTFSKHLIKLNACLIKCIRDQLHYNYKLYYYYSYTFIVKLIIIMFD